MHGSKHVHELDQYGSVFHDSGAERQLSFDRHQNRNIDAVHEYILISYATPLILRGNRTPDVRWVSVEMLKSRCVVSELHFGVTGSDLFTKMNSG